MTVRNYMYVFHRQFFTSFFQFELWFHHTLWSCYYSFYLHMLLLSNSYPTSATSVKVKGIGSHALGRLSSRAGGGGGYSTKRLRPKGQSLTLIFTIFHEKYTPFVYLLLTNGTPFKYRKIPKISPRAYIFQRPFLRGLFLEGLIYGGIFAFQNRLG